MKLWKQIPHGVSSTIVDHSGRKDISQPIPAQEINQLRTTLNNCQQLVAEARKLNSYPDGAYTIEWSFKRPIDTQLPHADAARDVGPLLLGDALVRAADGDGTGAVQSANALLNSAHYLRNEPVLITQLVRVVLRREAINALERAMTCANVSDDALKILQQGLEAEAAGNGLLAAVRGERAMTDQWARSVAKRESDWGRLKVSDDDIAWYLRKMTVMVDLAAKPVFVHASEWQRVENEVINARNDIKGIMPAINKVRDRLVRSDAEVQTAALAMAVERYRRAKGDWPSDLKQLVPAYMKSLPADKYTGEPFRLARTKGGVTVYSVTNRCNGEFNTIGFADNEGIGFRLLDAKSRH